MGRTRMGTREKRAARIRNSDRLGEFIRACAEHEETREVFRRQFSGGFGYHHGAGGVEYIAVPLGTYRDATPMEESNWSVIEHTMNRADSFVRASEHSGVVIHREGSALCGWIETVYVRTDDAVALRQAGELVSRLQDYPILDEDDCAIREWEADHPTDDVCYSGDPECGCDFRRRYEESSTECE